MTGDRPGPAQSVPVLTEVVSVPGPLREAASTTPRDTNPDPVPALQPAPAPDVPQTRVRDAVPPAWPGEDALVRQVLGEVQRQVDGVLEYRMREVLTPILARATDAVVREARHELARSLRDVVAQCVAQELQRQRSR
jgi:hypothetical protein